MKRLLDESTDELTRSLLEAGAEDRPPPGNQRQLIVALGAGGALGLFSSNAFAWLGTTAGKVTAAGVAVGVAGAVLVAGPLLRPADDARRVASGERSMTPEVSQHQAPPAPQAAVSDTPSEPALSAEPALAAQTVPGPGDAPSLASDDTAADEALPPNEPSAAPPARAVARGRSSSERRVARHASVSTSSGTRRGKKASRRVAHESTSVERVKGVDAVASTSAQDARRAALDAEVRLVDEMHAAARHHDRDALARLVAAYHADFPDGQLKKEVSDFETRLEQATPF